MKTYRATRTEQDIGVVTVEEGSRSACALRPRLDLRNHSPSGLEWTLARRGVVKLDVAVGAEQLKPVRVAFDLPDRSPAFSFGVPIVFLGSVHVVEMQGLPATGVSALLTGPAELLPQTPSFLSLLLAEAGLLALRTGVFPTLVATVREDLAALVASARTLHVNAGATVLLVAEGQNLSTPGTPAHGKAGSTVAGKPVLSVWDTRLAADTEQQGIGFHQDLCTQNYTLHRLNLQ